eukprot:4442194-Pyramimonas_sp.AAC.1
MLKNADGTQCTARFATCTQLHTHQAHALGGEHGIGNYARRLTITNMRPLCSTVFSDINAARAHMANSIARKRCRADGSYRTHGMIELDCNERPLCLK